MPNKKGGKKFKRGKKIFDEKKLIYKIEKEDQEYAQIKRVNGSGRYQLFCFDGTERLGICAGNIKKKFRFSIYDVVLVSKWDFQDNKCSIIHKYEEDEVQKLKDAKEFPENIQLEGETEFSDFNDDAIQFTYDLPTEKDSSDKDSSEKESSEDEIDLDDI